MGFCFVLFCFFALKQQTTPQIFCFHSSLKSPKGPYADASPAHRERGKSCDWAVTLSRYGLKAVKLTKKVPISAFLRFHSIVVMNSQAEGNPGHHPELMRDSYCQARAPGCPGADATTCQRTLPKISTWVLGTRVLLVLGQGHLCSQEGDFLCGDL